MDSIRLEELATLEAMYPPEYNYGTSGDCLEILNEGMKLRFLSLPVELTVVLTNLYPIEPPQLKVDSRGLGISRTDLFELQMRLSEVINDNPGEPVIFYLTSETSDFASRLRHEFVEPLDMAADDVNIIDDDDDEWLDASTGLAEAEAKRFMGLTTLDDVEKMLPSNIELLHAEVVLRHNLIRRFLQRRSQIQSSVTRAKSRQEADKAWDEKGKTEIVFHGSLRHNIGSIVRSGFVKPGDKTVHGEEVTVRCGSTWGQGIYTSPMVDYSLSYSDNTPDNVPDKKGVRRLLPGYKILVCAVVMGRKRHMTDTARNELNVHANYDSHVSPGGMEYIVFDSAQLLPIYVLHLNTRSRKAPVALTRNPYGDEVDADGKARRKLLTDRARKFLPNGFGASSGARFIVEEIADVDDDEEDWGEFQMERHQRGPALDEFQEDRLYW